MTFSGVVPHPPERPIEKSLADNPKTLRLVKLTESSIRKLEPDLVGSNRGRRITSKS